MNPSKKDVQDVYLKYSGYAIEGSTYYEFEPIQMQTDILYGESYAILEEDSPCEIQTTFQYEVLYVSDEGIHLKKFYRKKLDNVQTLESHPLFQCAIWLIEEIESEYINEEDIIQIVTRDVYASTVPTNSRIYRSLVERSKLFEQFFEDLYSEMDSYYNGVKQSSPEKWDFANYLQTDYGVEFEQSEGADIVVSNCLGLMRKLNLSYQEMAEYFCKYIL